MLKHILKIIQQYMKLVAFAGEGAFTKIWSKDYNKTYTKLWTKDYVTDYLKTYTKIWSKDYEADYTTIYTKEYTNSASYESDYSKDWSNTLVNIQNFGLRIIQLTTIKIMLKHMLEPL